MSRPDRRSWHLPGANISGPWRHSYWMAKSTTIILLAPALQTWHCDNMGGSAMKDQDKSKQQLISELGELRQRVAELEKHRRKGKQRPHRFSRPLLLESTNAIRMVGSRS